MRSKCSVKFLVQLIFFLLLNNKRLCKLFWEHLIWLRKFFNNSNLWFPLCRLRVYDSKEYKEHIHSPNLRNESVFCWSWFLLSRGLHVYMLTPPSAFSLKKRKKKKNENWVCFPFFTEKLLPKLHFLLVHSHQNEANNYHFETYLCENFFFVYQLPSK